MYDNYLDKVDDALHECLKKPVDPVLELLRHVGDGDAGLSHHLWPQVFDRGLKGQLQGLQAGVHLVEAVGSGQQETAHALQGFYANLEKTTTQICIPFER